jgi:hypothetical protein
MAEICDAMLDATDAATSFCTVSDGRVPDPDFVPVELPLLHAARAATQTPAANTRAKPW